MEKKKKKKKKKKKRVLILLFKIKKPSYYINIKTIIIV